MPLQDADLTPSFGGFGLRNPDGSTGILHRQCTTHYKTKPIPEYLRDRLGFKPGRRAPSDVQVEMWLGISTDEAVRQKPDGEEWVTKRYPLIDLGFSRAQLLNWFKDNYPDRQLPSSSCIGRPRQSRGAGRSRSHWGHNRHYPRDHGAPGTTLSPAVTGPDPPPRFRPCMLTGTLCTCDTTPVIEAMKNNVGIWHYWFRLHDWRGYSGHDIDFSVHPGARQATGTLPFAEECSYRDNGGARTC